MKDIAKLFWEIDKAPRKQMPKPKALGGKKQELFKLLCSLKGNMYIYELNKLKNG